MTKVWVFVVLITVTHCYYGYTVRGGPEQVGRAGRAAPSGQHRGDRDLRHAHDACLLGHLERDQVLGMSDSSRGIRGQALIGVALLLVIVAAGYGDRRRLHRALLDATTSCTRTCRHRGPASHPVRSCIFRDITVGSVGSLGRELPNGLLPRRAPHDAGRPRFHPVRRASGCRDRDGFRDPGHQPGAASRSAARGTSGVGETIGSVGVSKTTTLQGDATDLDNLLKALHPAALDETLTAIATALEEPGAPTRDDDRAGRRLPRPDAAGAARTS